MFTQSASRSEVSTKLHDSLCLAEGLYTVFHGIGSRTTRELAMFLTECREFDDNSEKWNYSHFCKAILHAGNNIVRTREKTMSTGASAAIEAPVFKELDSWFPTAIAKYARRVWDGGLICFECNSPYHLVSTFHQLIGWLPGRYVAKDMMDVVLQQADDPQQNVNRIKIKACTCNFSQECSFAIFFHLILDEFWCNQKIPACWWYVFELEYAFHSMGAFRFFVWLTTLCFWWFWWVVGFRWKLDFCNVSVTKISLFFWVFFCFYCWLHFKPCNYKDIF